MPRRGGLGLPANAASRVRRVKFGSREASFLGANDVKTYLRELEELQGLRQVFFGSQTSILAPSPRPANAPRRVSLVDTILATITLSPAGALGWPQRVTSLTITIKDSSSANEATSPDSLAALLAVLPSLVELKVVNPTDLFTIYHEGLKSALVGLRHLSHLVLRSQSRARSELVRMQFDEDWARWRPPLLKELEIETIKAPRGLRPFIDGLTSSLERLSLRFRFLEDGFDEHSPPVTFPHLTHLHLSSANSIQRLISLFSSAEITDLHLMYTRENHCAFLDNTDKLDVHLPSLRRLRVGMNRDEALPEASSIVNLRRWCHTNGVNFDLKTTSAAYEAVDDADPGAIYHNFSTSETRTTCDESECLLVQALAQVSIHRKMDDHQRAVAMERALNGVRVLLKMQSE